MAKSQILVASTETQLTDIVQAQGWRHAAYGWQQEPDQSLWLRFALHNSTSRDKQFNLVLGNPTLDYVDFYLIDEKGRIRNSSKVGSQRPISERVIQHRDFVFPLELRAYDQLQVYLHIQERASPYFPIDLQTPETFFSTEQNHSLLTGLICGAILLLASYFFITYILFSSPLRFWFALQGLLFLLLYLNYQGLTALYLPISGYLLQVSVLLFASILFVNAKISHYLLRPMPAGLRMFNYAIGALLAVLSLLVAKPYLLELILLFAGVHLLLLLVENYLYRNIFSSLPNRLFIFSWLAIYLVLFVQATFFLHGELMTTGQSWALIFMLLSGLFFQAVTIEAHGKVLSSQHNLQQDSQIQDLNYFYHLFRSSAEGLYTSDLDGKLLTTNPAMCQLFGYDSEAQLLAEIEHTSELYADQNQREQLLTDITLNKAILGREIKGRRRDGSEFWFSLSVQLHEHQEQRFMYGSIFDIDQKKRSDLSLEYLASHDPLTGVYNRAEFEKQLDRAIQQAIKKQTPLTLLYMDLDQFKVVNDTCGHKAGDQLLKTLAQKLEQTVANKGSLARLGGDEFAVLLTADQADSAYVLANRLLNTIQEFRFVWDKRIFHLGISIGLVPFDTSVTNAEQLMSMADASCYMAKKQGRNQIQTYSRKDSQLQQYESELEILDILNQALEENLFELYYQHYQPLTSVGQGHNYEVLLRLNHSDKQLLPEQFYPAAERFKLTSAIDKWVISHYCQWLSHHPEHLQQLNHCNININIHSLADPELKLFIVKTLEQYAIPYDKLCFELKESQAATRLSEATEFVRTLKKLGCGFVLDGFGNSFSSYTYLKQLPVDSVKIDGAVIKNMLSDPVDMAMVKGINEIVQAMGIDSIATHVESKALLIALGKMGINFAQGYGLAMPQPLSSYQEYNQINM